MFVEDMSVFLDTTSGFAQYATLAGGAQVPVIFDNGYAQGLAGMVETSSPSCQASTVDVAAVVQGNTMTIAATSYRVTEVHPDGTGLTTLLLELA